MEPSFRRRQLLAVGLSGAALAVAAIVVSQASRLFGAVPLPGDDATSRLVFLARWLLVPGLTLFAGVVAASGGRGFSGDAIEGTRTPVSHSLEINLRYNQNTLEQTTLAAIAWFGLALELPHERLVLIPALAALFALGRITFWIGYLVNPIGRAFGMAMTAAPTIGAYVWLVSHAFAR